MNIHSLINVTLLVYLALFPVILLVNKRFLRGKNANLNRAIKIGRKIHPFAGILLIISGGVHGYLKLGGQLQFHTGSLVVMSLLTTGIIGFLYKKTKGRTLALVHRLAGFVVILAFAFHYFFPWAL